MCCFKFLREKEMSLSDVTSGKDLPNDFNVVIEIPADSDPIKYEVDKETGVLCVDRFVGTGMRYPVNYGYIPQTIADDGDPVDVCVITPFPILAGAVIRCRPICVLEMEDEGGVDWKVLAVPVTKLCQRYADWKSVDDVPAEQLNQIRHFFEHYKDLEAGKWVKLKDWKSVEEAGKMILAGKAAYEAKA